MRKTVIKEGDVFGYFTVVKEVERYVLPSGKHERMILCKCKCGTEKVVFLNNLVRRENISCGCFLKEAKNSNFYKHGLSEHPLHSVWSGMRRRVKDQPEWEFNKHYFGKGVIVCKEWDTDFKCFYDWAMLNGYKKGLEIDRRNNDGNYEPSNCRFVTTEVNVNNRSTSILFKHNGEMLSLPQIARLENVCYGTLYSRVSKLKMTLAQALIQKDYRATENWREANKNRTNRGYKKLL